mgnify:CR=1 FL=1
MSGGGGDWLLAGRIAGAYGLRGWVRVLSFTDPPDNLFRLRDWRLCNSLGERPIAFAGWREQGRGLVARLDGVDDRAAAEQLRGSEIRIPAAALPPLEEGDYYWRELIGLRAYCCHGGSELLLGEVTQLLETGANDVLVLRPCGGSIDRRERLVPWLPGDVVQAVDREAQRLLLRWHPED